MKARFNILKSDRNRKLYWVEAVPDLQAAKDRVRVIGEAWPGKYVIRDRKTGVKISIEAGSPGVETPRVAKFSGRALQE